MKSAKEFKTLAKLQEQKSIEAWSAKLEKAADEAIESYEKECKTGDVVVVKISLSAENMSQPWPIERAFLENFIPKAREAGWIVSDAEFATNPTYNLSFTMQPKAELRSESEDGRGPRTTPRTAPRTRPEPISIDLIDQETLARLERRMRLEPIWFR